MEGGTSNDSTGTRCNMANAEQTCIQRLQGFGCRCRRRCAGAAGRWRGRAPTGLVIGRRPVRSPQNCLPQLIKRQEGRLSWCRFQLPGSNGGAQRDNQHRRPARRSTSRHLQQALASPAVSLKLLAVVSARQHPTSPQFTIRMAATSVGVSAKGLATVPAGRRRRCRPPRDQHIGATITCTAGWASAACARGGRALCCLPRC